MTASSRPPDIERLLSEEPFVRSLARTLLAEDADEVVQQTYYRALTHRAEVIHNRRNWLARVVRSVVSNLLRGRARCGNRELAASVSELVPSAEELAEREECRRALVAAVNRLAEPLRVVVLLRFFEGLPPRTIAKQLGVPVTTVWDRLSRALAILRARLDAEFGSRGDWLPMLAPFAAARPPLLVDSLSAPLPSGLLAMSTQAKLLAAVLVVILLSTAAFFWSHATGAAGVPSLGDRAALDDSRLMSPGFVGGAEIELDGTAVDATRRTALAAQDEVATTFGTLVVKVLWERDRSPAEGVYGYVTRPGAGHPRDDRGTFTGADGAFTMSDLEPGPITVSLLRGGLPKETVMEPGRATELVFELSEGLTLSGRVVDSARRPVPDARVWLSRNKAMWGEVVTTSDGDGEFTLRGIAGRRFLAAMADGYEPSLFESVEGAVGARQEIELTLPGFGGALEGRVTTGWGEAISGASVSVAHLHAPPPFGTRTDVDGAFRLDGVPVGKVGVNVRAPGWAQAHAEIEVVPRQTSFFDFSLVRGASLSGTVLDADYEPVPGASIRSACEPARAYSYGESSEDGTFELINLVPGTHDLKVTSGAHGLASAQVTLFDGQRLRWDMQLSIGRSVRGRLLDDGQSTPLAGWRVQAASSPVLQDGLRVFADVWREGRSDAEGRFDIQNVPAGPLRLLVYEPSASGPPCHWLDGVVAEGREVVVRVPESARSTGFIVGELRDLRGAPLGSRRVSVSAEGNFSMVLTGALSDEKAGRFELGPLPPGRYGLTIDWDEKLRQCVDSLELSHGQRLDLGVLALDQPGQLSTTVRRTGGGAEETDASLRLLSDRGRLLYAGLPATDDVALVPGEYVLLARAPGTATSMRRFQVLAGARTEVDLELQPGFEALLEFDLPQWATNGGQSTLELKILDPARGEILFERLERTGRGFASRCALAPGSYVVEARTETGLSAQGALLIEETAHPTTRTWELH